MPLNIRKADEPVEIEAINILIYGQPGSGKTSVASTANAALILDFDKGSHRSSFRGDAVQISQWGDVSKLSAGDLEDYDTIVIDTVGRCLDFVIADMPSTEGKTKLKRADGQPSLQGFGRVKSTFTMWLKQMSTLNKNVVLIAHDKEEKDDESRLIRPDVMGGSYAEIMKVVDFAGYLYIESGNGRVLNFSPTATTIGKNAAGFEPLRVPSFIEEPRWFGNIIEQMKDALSGQSEGHRKAIKEINECRAKVEAFTAPAEFNDYLPDVNKLDKPVQVQVKRFMMTHGQKHHIEYNKDSSEFEFNSEQAEAA